MRRCGRALMRFLYGALPSLRPTRLMPDLLLPVLAVLPWVVVGAFMAFGIREPRPLPGFSSPEAHSGGGSDGEASLVSIIIPARNEARNIGRCVASLSRLEGVDYEVIVVDDRSTDGTADEARRVEGGNAREIRVLEGRELPDGWFGKPWACLQGAQAARGELLLFTDADTVHHPELLVRCLAAVEEDQADVLSVLGRQEMVTFGEKLVQPQIFTLMGLRFRALDRVVEGERWPEAIANGQFILVTRRAYREIGGHEAVRGEVVEDLRLAQELVRAGGRLSVRQGEDVFSTRMYTSLRDLVNGWTKNVAIGARQSAGRWGAVAVPGILLFLVLFWILPPLTVIAVGVARLGSLEGIAPGVGVWGAGATLLSLFTWAGAYKRFDVSPLMSVLYPVGAGVVAFIALRSWIRGTRRIEWKGRRYGPGGRTAG